MEKASQCLSSHLKKSTRRFGATLVGIDYLPAFGHLFSSKTIKKDLLDAVKEVTWYPSWGELRLSNMIENREDWCISRQRAWGVPIPVFYAENGDAILDQMY